MLIYATKEKQYNLEQTQAYTTIECNLLVSFLINAKDYFYDYSLPAKLLNEMVKKINQDTLKRVGDYMKFNECGPMLAKKLLDEQYLQENIVHENNSSTKKFG